MKLNYIREFVTLAETLNFSRAAEKLYLAQPALSRHIAMIEEEMGGKLFLRDTRNVSLTPAGQEVYDCFREILRQYDRAAERTRMLSTGQTGSLRIDSPYYWTQDYTEPVVHNFTEKNPHCGVKIGSCQPGEGFANLADGKTDLLLSMTLPEDLQNLSEDIRVFSFTREPLCVLVRSDHPLANREEIRLEDIRDDPLVLVEESVYNGLNRLVIESLRKRGIVPDTRVYTQQIDTVAYSIQKTGGVAVLPYGVRHMDRDYIRFLPLKEAEFAFPMSFYYRCDNDNPLIPKFLPCATEEFSGECSCPAKHGKS